MGFVKAEGIDLNWFNLGHHECFARFTANREFDLSELSFAKFAAQVSRPHSDIMAEAPSLAENLAQRPALLDAVLTAEFSAALSCLNQANFGADWQPATATTQSSPMPAPTRTRSADGMKSSRTTAP